MNEDVPDSAYWKAFTSFSSDIPTKEIRFHITTKCSGFRLNLKRNYGLLSFYLINPNGGKRTIINLPHITDTARFWFGYNSGILFGEHLCPHDVNFQLGTWTLVYYPDTTVSVAGLLSFDFGVSTFAAAPISATGSCTNLDSESTCLVPEVATIGTH